MKISSIEIHNFKAVRRLRLEDLPDVVVIAGPNGCGKSCVLDAIRLVKSLYGGYKRQDEWHNFFNEFQVNLNNPEELRRLFTDTDAPISISVKFEFARSELDYIRENIEALISGELWEQHLSGGMRRFALGINGPLAEAGQKIDEATKAGCKEIIATLNAGRFDARVTLHPNIRIEVEPNAVLQFAFQIYDGKDIGIIDYHGPNRQYQRERIGGINVNIEETSARMAQHALYDSQNKYSNVKSELAAAYIRDILIEKAGGDTQQVPSIISTLRHLFDTFLPGKQFDGPRPGQHGELTFPVKLARGAEHDIDDLSSGEKELVYGYLRIRNVSPKNSIILLDEPELHLNPRLVLGLPSFYRQHLGIDLNNQLWMVTHSDAFLRDAFKAGGFSIFHMSPSSTTLADENQVVRISEENQIDRAVVDLIGNIAAYRPGSKLVIFESSESASFDSSMTLRLFPDFAEKINAVSGDNKYGVRQLYNALETAATRFNLQLRVYAITDRDSADTMPSDPVTNIYHWDVYHIENYLLDPVFIRKVIKDNPSYAQDMSEAKIEHALKHCAEQTLPDLVAHQLRVHIHMHLQPCLGFKINPRANDLAKSANHAITQVVRQVADATGGDLSERTLVRKHRQIERKLRLTLKTDRWRKEFRGRDILRRFSGDHLRGLPYHTFRDQIIARMADASFQPRGMARIIKKILDD